MKRILIPLCLVVGSHVASGQRSYQFEAPDRLFIEGKELFSLKNYPGCIDKLEAYKQHSKDADLIQEADYMIVYAAYEQGRPNADELLKDYLEDYPASRHSDEVNFLIGSIHFERGEYQKAIFWFNESDIDMLSPEQQEAYSFRLAYSLLQTGEMDKARGYFSRIQQIGTKYREASTYYVAYIDYATGKYNNALVEFSRLKEMPDYREQSLYYITQIYFIQNKYEKVVSEGEELLSSYPNSKNNSEVYRILGNSYYHLGNQDKASNMLSKYVSSTDSPLRGDLYILGVCYFNKGNYSSAVNALSQTVRENDALSQNAYLYLGQSYLKLKDKNNARMAFEAAATSSFDKQIQEVAMFNYALLIHETAFTGFGESVTIFEDFLNDFPNSQYADKVNDYLVEVYLTTKNYQAALNSINKINHPSTKILEAKQDILFQLGTQAFTNMKLDEAVDLFSKAINLGSYNMESRNDAYFWRGESYYRKGDYRQAISDYRTYLNNTRQRNTDMYALAHYNLGYCYFKLKEYGEAQNRFRQYINLENNQQAPALADAYNRIGDCNLHVRRFDEAKQYYTKAESLGTPAGDYSYYQLALVAGLQKDYSGKVTLLDRLAVKYPNSPYAINALYEKGRSYVQSNNSPQAIAAFRELLGKYPESPVSRKAAAEIGLLYYQNDDYDRAIEAYKHVVTQYPGSEEARLAMRDLKSIYVDANRVDEFAALAAQMPGEIRFEPSEQDSLTYIAAEKVYMKGEAAPAKESFTRYLQSYPGGAFSLNAHYYLCVIGKEQKDDEAVLEHAGKLLEYPDNPYSEEALLMHGEILFNRQQYDLALADYKKLQAKATTAERRQLGAIGVLRCGALMHDDAEVINAATALLAEAKLSPELRNEALYYRAKAYLNQKADKKAMDDLQLLAKDTRTLYGAEAKYLVALQWYNAGNYASAEKEILNFIDQSTPHAYWLARSFILLSDVYVAMDKKLDARQYLLSLQQNYQADDDIASMINERLEKLK